MPKTDNPVTPLEVISAKYRFYKGGRGGDTAISLKHLRAFGRELLERAAQEVEKDKLRVVCDVSDKAYNDQLDLIAARIRSLGREK